MRFLFVCLLLEVVYRPVSAQGDWVVTLKNDTLRGEVRILTYDLMDRVQVKSEEGRQVFTAVQVRNVQIAGDDYQPVKMDNRIHLMKLLSQGYLSLYAFRLENQNSYDGRCLVKLGGATLELPNLTFKKTMATFLEDCEAVSEKVKEGAWSKKDLDVIIKEYNTCIAAQSRQKIVADASDEKTDRIEALRSKVEQSDLESKSDVLELLSDLQKKVSKGEAVPNYLTEGLKSYLDKQPAFAADLAEVIRLVKN
ncbi:MAG: hypothetical protein ACOYXA_03780 [Bacteroidota bacterium]